MKANPNEPLGLPAGSVRALLAMLTIVGAFVLFYAHRTTFDQMLALTAAPTALYFGQYVGAPGTVNVPSEANYTPAPPVVPEGD